MHDEAEIMDEIHGLDVFVLTTAPLHSQLLISLCNSELKSFPPGAHWFCPRRNHDDPVDYDKPDQPEEEMSPETKHELIEDAKKRHDIAYRSSLITGLDQEIAGRMLQDYIIKLNGQLANCDKCVRNWHQGRKAYLKHLAE